MGCKGDIVDINDCLNVIQTNLKNTSPPYRFVDDGLCEDIIDLFQSIDEIQQCINKGSKEKNYDFYTAIIYWESRRRSNSYPPASLSPVPISGKKTFVLYGYFLAVVPHDFFWGADKWGIEEYVKFQYDYYPKIRKLMVAGLKRDSQINGGNINVKA